MRDLNQIESTVATGRGGRAASVNVLNQQSRRTRLNTNEKRTFASSRSIAIGAILTFVAASAAAQTTNVNVVNTPSVRVANPILRVGVSGNVPVTGTVSANITNGSVAVSNTKAAPLFVDTGESARAAVGGECNGNFSAGVAACTLATVPASQTLVIEMITCRASIVQPSTPFPQLPVLLNVGVPVIGNPATSYFVSHTLLLTPTSTLTGSSPPFTYFGVMAPMRVYSVSPAAGSTAVGVELHAAGQTDGQGGVVCTFSGYTVIQ
jgi:hypothetical protein